MFTRCRSRLFTLMPAFALLFAVLAPVPSQAQDDSTSEPQYRIYDEITTWVRDRFYSDNRNQMLDVVTFTRSGKFRDLYALRLAIKEGSEPEARPGVLIVANLEGNHIVGTEVVLRLVDRILAKVNDNDEVMTDLLTRHTLYLVPVINVDRMITNNESDVLDDSTKTITPNDEDRDGYEDEDGPDDLNGDGFITMMRVYEDDAPNMMPDPAEPRLNVSADQSKGERPMFRLFVEGLDNDEDGLVNEDGLGGVNLNQNFPHRFQMHTDDAGRFPVSEGETKGFVDLVLDYPNIAAVLTYGPHDNLVNTPGDKGRDEAGAPVSLDPRDVALYELVGERYREHTGWKEASSSSNADGSFFSWAYAHLGIPSFATTLWSRPEQGDDEDPQSKTRSNGESASDGELDLEAAIEELIATAAEKDIDVNPEDLEDFTVDQINRYRRMLGLDEIEEPADTSSADETENKGKSKDASPRDKDEAAWLAYSDSRSGEGFVDWQPYDHPQLGKVEIGGWVPGFKSTPPASELEGIVDDQLAFIVDLINWLPRISVSEPEIKRLASGLYDVKISVTNDGTFPTATAMGERNRKAPPVVVKISTPNEQIVAGQRVIKTRRLEGSGGTSHYHWIVREGDGDEIMITVTSQKFGTVTKTVSLNAGGGQ